ncbi:MAG: APC family permease [Thaumarchaeota archaeon]|nr:APC family permease [Nitrososphaerota archaeon]
MAEEKKVFIRNATGLTRELSLFDSVIFNLSVSAPGFGILLYTYFGYPSFAGTSLILAALAVVPILILHAFVSGQMMSAMPRSGFDYVFVSRVTRPVIGFSNSFTFFFFQALFMGIFFVFMNSYLSSFFSTLGLITGNSTYGSIATTLTQPINVVIVGTIILLIIVGIFLLGLRVGKRAIIITQLIGWAGLITALAILASSNQSAFAAAWNHYDGTELLYSNATTAAQANGLAYSNTSGTFLAAGFFTIFSVLGYQSVGYLGGEVKRSGTNIIKSMIIAVLVTVLVLAGALIVIQNTMGYDFLAGAGFMSVIGKIAVAPYYIVAAAMLVPNPYVVFLMYLSIWAWLFVTIAAIFLLLSRMIFAWSFDGVIPTKFADISERFRTPTYSVLLIGVLIELGIFLSLYTQFAILVNLGLVLLATYGVNTFTSAVFPYLKPAVFAQSPPVVNYKIGGKVPLITITGGLTTLLFLILIYEIIQNPAITGAVTPLVSGAIVVVAAAGAVLFYVMKAYKKTRGINLDYVFAEIPPE